MQLTVEIPRPRTRREIERTVALHRDELEDAGEGGLTVVLPQVDDREDDVLADLGFAPAGDQWLLRARLPAGKTTSAVHRVGTGDIAALADLYRKAPEWRLGTDMGDVPRSETIVYHRRGQPAAFATYVMRPSGDRSMEAVLIGYGVLPGFAGRERAVAGSLLHASLREMARDGAGSAVAEVPPEAFDRVNMLEFAGFRYESATRSYHLAISTSSQVSPNRAG